MFLFKQKTVFIKTEFKKKKKNSQSQSHPARRQAGLGQGPHLCLPESGLLDVSQRARHGGLPDREGKFLLSRCTQQ